MRCNFKTLTCFWVVMAWQPSRFFIVLVGVSATPGVVIVLSAGFKAAAIPDFETAWFPSVFLAIVRLPWFCGHLG